MDSRHLKQHERKSQNIDEFEVLYGNTIAVKWFFSHGSALFDTDINGTTRLNYMQIQYGLKIDGFTKKQAKDVFWRVREIANGLQ